MGRGNSDIIYFLEQHEQEIINCCKKGMSNNEVIELLKIKYNRDVADITYRKFKAGLNLTKSDFLETLLDEIMVMKTSGATDANGQLKVPNNQSSTGDDNGTIGKDENDDKFTFVVRVSDKFALAMHIDTDEANAAAASGTVYGRIVK